MPKVRGRPTGARDRLRNNFLAALADDFKAHGVDAIKDMREKDPSGYIRAIASLMPKEMDITHQVDPMEQLTDEQLQRIVDAANRIVGGEGIEAIEGEVLPQESGVVH